MYKFRPLDEVKAALNAISPSFCAAKWYRSCLWLNSGQTASCHLPPAHNLNPTQVAKDPRALHNTDVKFKARQEMLDGKRPTECKACWDAEDAGGLSDRIVKSRTFSDADLNLIAKAPAHWSVNPTHLEISFGDKCNFACTYCNSEFSTRWQADVENPYVNLRTSGTESYTKPKDQARTTQAFYMDAFDSWWPRLKNDLRVLRITGGEPLLSADFWRFIERIGEEEVPFYIGVNTNLGVPRVLIERLLEAGKKIKHFELYTSNEATGSLAAYLRDGLDYAQWRQNLIRCRDSGVFEHITVMMTLGALSGWGLVPLFEDLKLEKYKNQKCYIEMSLNLIRFPEFQSFNAMPIAARVRLADEYINFLQTSEVASWLSDVERGTLTRIIAQLMHTSGVSVDQQILLEEDLKSFVGQYDQRRGKSLFMSAPENLQTWIRDWGRLNSTACSSESLAMDLPSL